MQPERPRQYGWEIGDHPVGFAIRTQRTVLLPGEVRRAPQLEIPNGLGLEFCLEAPQTLTSRRGCNLIAFDNPAEVATAVCAILIIEPKNPPGDFGSPCNVQ
jgi:hypothetical protein